jgi:hypothetical protein
VVIRCFNWKEELARLDELIRALHSQNLTTPLSEVQTTFSVPSVGCSSVLGLPPRSPHQAVAALEHIVADD